MKPHHPALPLPTARRPRRLLPRLLAALTATTAAFAQNEPVIELSPFEVKATQQSSDRYGTEQSNAGTIIAKDRAKIPFITSVMTEEFISDLRLDSPSDFTDFLSGVSKSGTGESFVADENLGGSMTYVVRGFESQPLFNGFKVDGLLRNPDNVGRIEVIKSPNSVLYGQGQAGGIIDISTKAPSFKNTGSLLLGFGTSDSSSKGNSTRAKVALTGAFGEHAALQLNAGYQRWDREQYFFDARVFGLGGGLKFKLGKKTTLDLATEYTNYDGVPSRTAAFVSVGTGPARVVDPYNRLRRDRNFTYNGPNSENTRDTTLSTAYLTSSLSDSITLRVGAVYGVQNQDSTTFSNVFGLATAETVTVGNFTKTVRQDTVAGQKLDLVHQGAIGEWKIDSVVGYETHDSRTANVLNRTDASTTPLPVTIPFSRRAAASDFPAVPSIERFNVLTTNEKIRLQWTNLRFSQFVETPDKRGSLMWGVAKGDGESETRNLANNTRATSEGDGVTYTGGVTYRLLDAPEAGTLNSLTLFANTATSFTIQGGNQQNPNSFNGFTTVEALQAFVNSLAPHAVDPQTGKGVELGLRAELLKNKLKLSVAYFDQSRENIARSFFVRQSLVAGNTNESPIATFTLAAGKERSKGVDADITWQVTPQLSLIASAMASQGKVVANPESPEEIGFGLINAPETRYSFWALYRADKQSALSGFTVGLGATHNSETRIRPQVPDRFRLSDDYTVARALLRYTIPGAKRTHEFSLNVDNLLDEEYTMENNFLSDPRTLKFSYLVRW